MDHIIIVGASGFIGSRLIENFKNYEIRTLKASSLYSMTTGDVAEELNGSDIVINLAGETLLGLWTKRKRKRIYDSRVRITEILGQGIKACTRPPGKYLCTSAVGIYKSNIIVDEDSCDFAGNFMADTLKDLERTALSIRSERTSVTIMRLGPVFGREGGAYRILRSLSRLNLAGYFGRGDQYISFVCISDLIRAIDFIIKKDLKGIVNITAPVKTTYKELLKKLNRKFNSRILWPVPEWLLKGILGEASSFYLEGQFVEPAVLIKNSFNFEASDISECIDKIEAN